MHTHSWMYQRCFGNYITYSPSCTFEEPISTHWKASAFMNVRNFLISEVNLNISYSKPRSFPSALVFLIIIWLLIRRRVRRACICSRNLFFVCVCVISHMWEKRPSPFNCDASPAFVNTPTSTRKTRCSLRDDVSRCKLKKKLKIPEVVHVEYFEVRNRETFFSSN